MINQGNSHTPVIAGSSNRVFGYVMSIFFTLIALMPLYAGQPVRLWALLTAGLFFLLAVAAPNRLGRLNRSWMRLGLLMSRVVSPIALGIVFFGVITPFGLILKLFGKRLMPMHFDRKATSYWLVRQPPGPAPETMKHPFWPRDYILSFLKELFAFLRARKKFWLLPILLVMALLGALIVLAQGSAIAPFIYTLF
jgi:hypothetical protein